MGRTEMEQESAVIVAPDVQERRESARDRGGVPRQPLFHVVIWNDEVHTYEYVIELLMELFGYSYEKAFVITDTVHQTGRGIAFTTHKELAELKRDQILGAGADWRMEQSHGPIRATIEPVV